VDDDRGTTSIKADGYSQSPSRGELNHLDGQLLENPLLTTQIRQLMGPTPYTFPLVLAVLAAQLSIAIYMRSHHPFSLPFILTAYVFGGTLNQNTFLAIHEITHNLAFKSLRANKILAIVSNLAIGIPYAMAFKGYHREHHKYLGEEGIDTDLPSRFEALVLNNVAGKTFFA
jgi:sphingolipid delta-4 desaturase